jgi:hypothetical protein
MDATAVQLAEAFESYIDTHDLAYRVDIAVWGSLRMQMKLEKTGNVLDFQAQGHKHVRLFRATGTEVSSAAIMSTLADCLVRHESCLPSVVLVRFAAVTVCCAHYTSTVHAG